MKFKHNNKNIYFIHIPRTAGSYVENKLCEKFKINKNWHDSNTENLFGLEKINKNHYLTLQHLTLNEIEKYNFINSNENNYIFTIIRNPFDRVITCIKTGL